MSIVGGMSLLVRSTIEQRRSGVSRFVTRTPSLIMNRELTSNTAVERRRLCDSEIAIRLGRLLHSQRSLESTRVQRQQDAARSRDQEEIDGQWN